MRGVTATLRCADCGQPLARARGSDAFVHASRTVAACDLDSDHVPRPDWAGLGEVPCRRCGAPTAARDGDFAHVDPAREADHPADPRLPLL